MVTVIVVDVKVIGHVLDSLVGLVYGQWRFLAKLLRAPDGVEDFLHLLFRDLILHALAIQSIIDTAVIHLEDGRLDALAALQINHIIARLLGAQWYNRRKHQQADCQQKALHKFVLGQCLV